VLVEDLPDFRQLHEDLDRAASAHPDAPFLRRYRADRSQLTRQAAERVLADTIVVRSEFARQGRIGAGIAAERVELAGRPTVVGPRRHPDGVSDRSTLLLAGLATARSGLFEALAVSDALPATTLVLRAGEGLEPPDALSRPHVRQGSPDELEHLTGIDVVLAPSWCEADLPQVRMAAALGIPVVATDRAAGTVDLRSAGASVPPGDIAALIAAVTEVLRV
jgi:hypothetical protein